MNKSTEPSPPPKKKSKKEEIQLARARARSYIERLKEEEATTAAATSDVIPKSPYVIKKKGKRKSMEDASATSIATTATSITATATATAAAAADMGECHETPSKRRKVSTASVTTERPLSPKPTKISLARKRAKSTPMIPVEDDRKPAAAVALPPPTLEVRPTTTITAAHTNVSIPQPPPILQPTFTTDAGTTILPQFPTMASSHGYVFGNNNIPSAQIMDHAISGTAGFKISSNLNTMAPSNIQETSFGGGMGMLNSTSYDNNSSAVVRVMAPSYIQATNIGGGMGMLNSTTPYHNTSAAVRVPIMPPSSMIAATVHLPSPAINGFSSATMSGIPTAVTMAMSQPSMMAPVLTSPPVTTDVGTINIMNSPAAGTTTLTITEMSKKNARLNVFSKVFLFMITVAIIFIQFFNKNHLNKENPTKSVSDINTSQPLSSVVLCFDDNLNMEYNEDEKPHTSCDPDLPSLPCPGLCRNGILVECSNPLLVPSDDKRSCTPSNETNILMSQIVSAVSALTIERRCNWDTPNEDGVHLVPIAQVATAVGKDESLIKTLSMLNNDIIESDGHIGFTSEFATANLELSLSCWVKLWFSWFLFTCVQYTFAFIALIIGAMFNFIKFVFHCIIDFMYEHPGYSCIGFIVVIALNQNYQRKAMRGKIRTVKELALQKLSSCAKDVGYPTLCLRDEIASELYPMGGKAKDYFIREVWPRVSFEIRGDNRISKNTKHVFGKGDLEYFIWICDPSRKT